MILFRKILGTLIILITLISGFLYGFLGVFFIEDINNVTFVLISCIHVLLLGLGVLIYPDVETLNSKLEKK